MASKYRALFDQIDRTDDGDDIAAALTRILQDTPSTLALKMWLDSALRHLSSSHMVRTPSEQAVMDMLEHSPNGELGLDDILRQGSDYELPSLAQLGHASKVVNELAARGLVGKWRVAGGKGRPKTRFGAPERALLNSLARLDVMPSEVDHEVMLELAKITGMSLAKIVEILNNLP